MEKYLSPELIALISLFAALLAAVAAWVAADYARRAWSEARRANEISVHSNRMDIYRSLHELHFSVQAHGVGIETKHVARFYHPFREARFYFSKPQKLAEYFDVCFELAECARKLARLRSGQEDSDIERIHQQQDALLDREQSLFKEAEKYVEKDLYGAIRHG